MTDEKGKQKISYDPCIACGHLLRYVARRRDRLGGLVLGLGLSGLIKELSLAKYAQAVLGPSILWCRSRQCGRRSRFTVESLLI